MYTINDHSSIIASTQRTVIGPFQSAVCDTGVNLLLSSNDGKSSLYFKEDQVKKNDRGSTAEGLVYPPFNKQPMGTDAQLVAHDQ